MDKIREAFNEASREYDRWYDTPLGGAADRIEKALMLAAAEPQPGEDALDLGADTGQLSLQLARLGLNVTGVDVSPGMLAAAEKKAAAEGLRRCRFLQGDASHLPFPSESFDLVTVLTALEFFPEPAQALREAWRTLRPGGRLVVGVIHRDSAWGEVYRQAAEAGDPVFSQAHLFGRQDLAPLLSPAPAHIQGGLYLTPQDQPVTLEAALRLDEELHRRGGAPGFLVARWNKPKE